MRRLLSRRRGDRGAGLVEYGLIASILLVVVVGGMQYVQSSGEKVLDEQAGNINYANNAGGVPTTDGSGNGSGNWSGSGNGSGSGSGNGNGGSTTTTTTAAPTTTATTAAPPTTAVPTTTTTKAPTTTTTAPSDELSAVTFTSVSPKVDWWNGQSGAWANGLTFGYGWKNGANVIVSVTRTFGNGKTESYTQTVWVASGSSTPYLPVNALAKSASGNVDHVDVAVTRIETQDANWQNRTFNVDSPRVRIYAPKV
jgi:Flp pilus assembly pilin Flp